MSGDLLALGAVAALAGVVALRGGGMVVLYAMPYGDAARPVARALKTAESEAVKTAARVMAPLVDSSRPVFVPVPSSGGDTTANRVLARAIAALTGGVVADILGRKAPVQSSYERFYRGLDSPRPTEHRMVALGTCPPGDVYLVDNVAATGNTLRAAKMALGRGRGLVYAAALSELASGTRLVGGSS